MRCLILFPILLIIVAVMPSQAVTESHYIVVGHIHEPYTSDIVIIQNVRTQEIVTVEVIDCDHNVKEYLFELANLKQGWQDKDTLDITYGDITKQVTVNTEYIGIQTDFNNPFEYIPLIAGTVLVFAGVFYYIRKKEKEKERINELTEVNKMTEGNITTLPDIPSTYERFAILIIFGSLAIYMAVKGNNEAAAAFATTIATYFLSRQGA